ncbi:TonB-dependent receptor, partial [uncultured Parabacteroides sp.]|uniref:TonB-dependent receptor n=1 Tax=uncultured Parabacteroides sp. TaxID=512312 RepID=UPI0025E53816
MKLFFIFMISSISLLHASGSYAQTARISLDTKNQTVQNVLEQIESKSNFSFFYNNRHVDLNRKVSVSVDDADIFKVLDVIFSGTNVGYSVVENRIVLSVKSSNPVISQNRKKITGTVVDATGVPIIGANVMVKGTTNGTVTDMDGRFLLETSDDAILEVSYIGYASYETPVSNRTSFNVVLKEDLKTLDEVVVVAYGTQNKRSVTGSMETVKLDDLSDLPVGQFSQKMQGQVTGVQISQGSGRPGQGVSVRIRGAASISTSSTPLYVVDGFPIVGDINNINPNEIESMTVLKDAAATSLYGSRAAFGVILITTKRAKAGETKVSANAYTGIQQVPKNGRPELMNGTEWAQFRKEHYEDMGIDVPDAFKNPSQYGEGYDWYDAMLRTAMIGDYSVSVNASKGDFTSSVVLGYFRQEGVVNNSSYNRFTARANNEYKFNDKFKIAFNIAPSFSFDDAPPADGFFGSGGGLLDNARLTPPILSWKDADGSLPVTVTTPGVTSFETPNWIRSAKDITNKSQWNRLLTNGYLEYEPIKDLKLKTSISVDLGNSNTHYFQPSTAGRAFAAAPSKINAYLADKTFRYWSWLSENTVSYAKQFGDHSFDILGGYTVQQYRSDYSEITGSNFPDDRIQTINMALVKNNPSMDIQEWSMISYLARLNYDYKGRYLLNASIRRDGSSRFGRNNKWGNFPSVSLGWVASEEEFMQKIEPISFLKIRGSYGLVGNNNIGNYTHYNVVSSANTVFGDTSSSGTAVTQLGNDNLGWETTKQLDLGVDFGFLNNRINFTYDYYDKRTTELLYNLPIPQESGFSSFTGNVGKLKFWGHEFSLDTKNLVGEFKWNTNFNIAFSDNKVLALSGGSNQIVAYAERVSTITKVGGRIGQFYGPIQLGVYVDQNDFDRSPKMVDSQVGTIKFKDINGDNVITLTDVDGDKTEIGNPFPKFVFGFTNNFSYKNFDLSIVTSGTYGNKVWANEEGITNLDGVFNVLKAVKDRWRSPENPGAGLYGKSTGATEPDRSNHSRSVYNGSH